MKDFDTLYNVISGKHFYQFYKNENDYFETMLSYFQAGLEKGEACLWITSEKIGFRNVERMASRRFPLYREYIETGQLKIVPGESWYLVDGLFNEAHSLNNAATFIQQKQASGYQRIRASGDIASIPSSERPKVESYERKVGEVVKSSALIALCAYPILECALQETKMAIQCHDDVLVGHI